MYPCWKKECYLSSSSSILNSKIHLYHQASSPCLHHRRGCSLTSRLGLDHTSLCSSPQSTGRDPSLVPRGHSVQSSVVILSHCRRCVLSHLSPPLGLWILWGQGHLVDVQYMSDNWQSYLKHLLEGRITWRTKIGLIALVKTPSMYIKGGESFHNVYIYQIFSLYTLNVFVLSTIPQKKLGEKICLIILIFNCL